MAKPLIITYFDTDCHFCQAEIRSMREYEPLHKAALIYLISGEPMDSLQQFSVAFKLDSLKSISGFRGEGKKVVRNNGGAQYLRV